MLWLRMDKLVILSGLAGSINDLVTNPVAVGTTVTLIGRVGDQSITMQDLAEHTQSSIVALMNDFAPRLQRIIVS